MIRCHIPPKTCRGSDILLAAVSAKHLCRAAMYKCAIQHTQNLLTHFLLQSCHRAFTCFYWLQANKERRSADIYCPTYLPGAKPPDPLRASREVSFDNSGGRCVAPVVFAMKVQKTLFWPSANAPGQIRLLFSLWNLYSPYGIDALFAGLQITPRDIILLVLLAHRGTSCLD